MAQKLRKLFGKQVRERRLELGYSQEVFADLVGYDRTYISGIERGNRNPSIDAIEAIAKALRVRVSALLDGA